MNLRQPLSRLFRKRDKLELQRLLESAESIPIVKNSLLTPEQVVYSLAWRDLVNPGSELISTIYPAIGPDLSTVLITTDATTIYGLDIEPPDINKLREHLLNLENIDEPKLSLDWRREAGFWEPCRHSTPPIEELIAIELKKMGVSKDTVTVSGTNGRVQLEFNWGMGYENKKRTIVYSKGDMNSSFKEGPNRNLQESECFYLKSYGGGPATIDISFLKYISQFIKSGGTVLVGRVFGDLKVQENAEKGNKKLLGREFSRIGVNFPYTDMMMKLHEDQRNNMSYGWRLDGYRKK